MNPMLRPLALAATVFAGACLAPSATLAAESYDNCTGFIDSLPATISTQGVWCLRSNLVTSMTSGNAITIAGNNITIDCNDFKIGGLAAGTASEANGIWASGRLNATIRGCGIRGFHRGIWLQGSGHLVEDNRIDGSLLIGIQMAGDGNRVVRNRVIDTGGRPGYAYSYGMYGEGDFIDNVVDGVFADHENSLSTGLMSDGFSAQIRGNVVRGLVSTGSGWSNGIRVLGVGVVVAGNSVTGNGTGMGISASEINNFCRDNTSIGFAAAYDGFTYAEGNLPN